MNKIRKNITHQEFLSDLKIKNKYAYENLIFLSKYKRSKEKILVKDNYGELSLLPTNLLRGEKWSIESAVSKMDYFLNMLKEKNEFAFNNLKFKTSYVKSSHKILAESKYGDVLVKPNNLLSGSNWDIRAAVDKTSYFLNNLKDVNLECFDMIITIDSEFIRNSKPIYFTTKYGKCSMTPNNMLCGKIPNPRSAINTMEYYIDTAKKVHDGRYDYSKVVESDKVKDGQIIICEKHGEFIQSLSGHIHSLKGCPECAKESSVGYYHKRNAELMKEKYKKIDGFVYVIEMESSNTKESFIKIGITNDIKRRMKEIKSNSGCILKLLNVINTNIYDAIYIEEELHNLNLEYKYVPNFSFHGMTECFSKLNSLTLKKINEIKNKSEGGIIHGDNV